MEVRPFQIAYRAEPWKVVLGCIMCARTRGNRVREVIKDVLARWPTRAMLVTADDAELAAVLRPLGFQNVRARRIKAWLAFRRLPGQYALDSVRIFCRNDLTTEPEDRVLRAYVEQERKRRNDDGTVRGRGLA